MPIMIRKKDAWLRLSELYLGKNEDKKKRKKKKRGKKAEDKI